MDNKIYNELFFNYKEKEDKNDPFYSESNMKHLRESIEQSKRGESSFFDVDEYIKQHPFDLKSSN